MNRLIRPWDVSGCARVAVGAIVLFAGSGTTVRAQEAALPTIARLHYDGGGDWYANPSSLPNLLAAVGEWTELRVVAGHVEVRPTDPDLATIRSPT